MAKFKNIYSHSGKFTFKESRIAFSGEFETEDKELISFLENTPDFICLEAKKEEEVNPELEELKKLCDEKGIKYHHKAGIDKLKQLLAEND